MRTRFWPFAVIALLVLSLFAGCGRGESDNQKLVAVGQLLDSGRVDSACVLFEGVRVSRLQEAKDSAFYYLLKAQADYRAYRPVDSLGGINFSIRHYQAEGSGGKLRLAAAWFYKGVILYTQGNVREGVFCLERSRQIAEKTQDVVLRHKIYEQFTVVNAEAGDFRAALRYAKLSIRESQRANRTDWLAHTWNNMAFVYSQLGLQDSTAWCLRQNMELLPKLPEKSRPFVMANLGAFLMQTDTAMARKYLEQSLRIMPTSAAYDNLATLSAQRGDTATASEMWRKALAIATDAPTQTYVLRSLLRYRTSAADWRGAAETAQRLLELADSVERVRPENNVKAVQVEFERMVMSHEYERKVTIALVVIVTLVLLTIIGMLYSWYRSYKARAARAVDQLLIKSYEAQVDNLRRMAGDKTKEIAQLNRKRDQLLEKHHDSLKRGYLRYNEVMRGETTVLWRKHDFESFVEYYSLVDVQFVASLSADYDGLSPKQKFFLIMEHAGKSDAEIQAALGVAEVTMRSIRSRIGKRKKK